MYDLTDFIIHETSTRNKYRKGYKKGYKDGYANAITEFAEAVRNAYATMQSISEVERATANTIVMGIETELKGD